MLNWIFDLTILELKRKGTCSKLLRIMVCYVKDTVFTYGVKREVNIYIERERERERVCEGVRKRERKRGDQYSAYFSSFASPLLFSAISSCYFAKTIHA